MAKEEKDPSRSEIDRELIERFHGGDEKAFTLLVDHYKKKVYFTAYRFVGNHDEADDLSQETFMRVYGSLRRFRGDSSFYTWMYRIVVNLCINHLKMKSRATRVPLEDVAHHVSDPRSDPERDLKNRKIRDRLNEAIARLPEKQRLVFMLHQFDGLQHKEIARMLNKSEGGIKANYFHAIRKLRRHMEEFLT